MFIKLDGRSNKYYAHYKTLDQATKKLVPQRTCLETSDAREAAQIAKESKIEELELASKIGAVTAETVTKIVTSEQTSVLQAIEKWEAWVTASNQYSELSRYNALCILRAWARDTGIANQPLSAVTALNVNQYVNNAERKRTTRIRILSLIRGLLEFARNTGLILGNPAAIVRVSMDRMGHAQKESKRVEVFTPEQYAALLSVATPFWKAACSISYQTGLRLSDIVRLERDCIVGQRLVVWMEKTDKRLEIDVPPALHELLSRPVQHLVYLFPEQLAIIRDPRRRGQLSSEFRKLCDSIGLNNHTFHGLRHTFVTNQIQKGIDIEAVA